MAEAPVPMTAMRLPVRSTSWSQRAEWKISPRKSSMPSISGRRGSERPPEPEMTVRAAYSCGPSGPSVRTTQRWSSSLHVASTTAVPKTKRSRVPESSATLRVYSQIYCCGE